MLWLVVLDNWVRFLSSRKDLRVTDEESRWCVFAFIALLIMANYPSIGYCRKVVPTAPTPTRPVALRHVSNAESESSSAVRTLPFSEQLTLGNWRWWLCMHTSVSLIVLCLSVSLLVWHSRYCSLGNSVLKQWGCSVQFLKSVSL